MTMILTIHRKTITICFVVFLFFRLTAWHVIEYNRNYFILDNKIKTKLKDKIYGGNASDSLGIIALNTSTGYQIQRSHATVYDRYPRLFLEVKLYVDQCRKSHPEAYKSVKILSFGSSSGMEALTLAEKYFPSSNELIYGVDLDNDVLEHARNVTSYLPAGKVTFFNGFDVDIGEYGPYDVIFANAVLCHNPPGTNDVDEFAKLFSFETFVETLNKLDHVLKPGGILQVTNSNYNFTETPLASKYTAKSSEACHNGWVVPLVDRQAGIFLPRGGAVPPCLFVKNLA